MTRYTLVNADWNFWPDGWAPPAIWAACADLGFEGLELGVYDPDVELSRALVAQAGELAERHRIGVRAALFSMPPARWPEGALASADHAPAAVRAIVETGRRAADLGASVLGVWPGADALTGQPEPDAWSRTADSLLAIADGVGLLVAVEPKPGQIVGTTEDAARICHEVDHPRLGVLLDTAHGFAGGDDVASLPDVLAGQLFHVHLGDSDGGDADADLPPGAVHDFAPFLAALDRTGYSGAVSFDLYGAVSTGALTGEQASRAGLAHVTSAVR